MSKHSDRFNELPLETRQIASNLMLEHQIRDLHLEMGRLKQRYHTSRWEINEKIKYCERELEKKDAEVEN